MSISEFKSEDYLRLKWHLVFLVFCIALVVGVFIGVNKYESDANRELNIVRADMNSAQTVVDQIEQEEATITEYIGRYQDIKNNGLVAAKDRIQLLETVAQIRARYNLFPIQMETLGLPPFTLPYDTSVYQSGEPVYLETSPLEISLPLLHEDDLVNFLNSLLGGNELIVPVSCNMSSPNRDSREYLRLGQHISTSCTLLWYSFTVMSKNGEPL